MKRISVIFKGPYQIECRQEPSPAPGDDQVRVEAILSAISPGTEMLIYRGNFPPDLPVDSTIKGLSVPFGYPLKYGYASIGRVAELGPGVPEEWLDRRVFCFQPHESQFLASPHDLFPVPPKLDSESAVFLPISETATNLVMDGRPCVGERVAVFGQGIVGLLTTALLNRFPLQCLVTLDRFAPRRETSRAIGAHASLDPGETALYETMSELFQGDLPGADLIYEISGDPEALNTAIRIAGYGARIIVGSWYGTKRGGLDLGGIFHRNRLKLVSSQVSTISPEHSGRWNKARRIELAWKMTEAVAPGRFVTHRFPVDQADRAYRLIDRHPEEALQVLLVYTHSPADTAR